MEEGARRGKPRCDSPPVCGRAGTVLCRVAGRRREWSVRRRESGARCVCCVVNSEEEANQTPFERRGLRLRSDADSAWSAVVPSREQWQASAVWRTRRSIVSGMSVRPSWLTVQSGSTSGSSNRRAAESKVTRDVQPQCRESGTPDGTTSCSPVRAVAVAPASMRSANRGTEQTGTCWPAAALPGVFPGAKDDICPIRSPRGDARCRLLGARATRPMPRPSGSVAWRLKAGEMDDAGTTVRGSRCGSGCWGCHEWSRAGNTACPHVAEGGRCGPRIPDGS